MEPTTQTQPYLDATEEVDLTSTAVLNPAVALVSVEPHLSVLIARHSLVALEIVRLCGVRRVRLPRGVVRLWLRAMSRIFPVRLPDEFEYNEIRFVKTYGLWTARVPNGGGIAPARRSPFPIVQLTNAEYHRMMNMRGREIEECIREIFAKAIVNWDEPDVEESDRDRRAA